MEIVRTFLNERQVILWLRDWRNEANLKVKYPVKQHLIQVNLDRRQIEVTEKNQQMNTDKFTNWLSQMGVEILPTSSEHEAVRFKGREVGVLYKSGKVSGNYVTEAIKCFKQKKKWNGKPVNVGRKNSYVKQKTKLIVRDGTDCFLCGKPLKNDITLEHLIALSSGGSNRLANMVLMHEECNKEVNNKPVSEKVKLAIKYRKMHG